MKSKKSRKKPPTKSPKKLFSKKQRKKITYTDHENGRFGRNYNGPHF